VPPVTAAGPDLVVLAYQVWYLAPSLPVRSLLATPALAGRTVLGLVACRNMWYSAALEVARDVDRRGGRYLGTVAAIDDAPALLTFVTTLRWLLLGRREAFWRFPRAGVSAGELDRLRSLGEELATALTTDRPGADRAWAAPVLELLRRRDAAPVVAPVAAADLIAGRVFRVWGRTIRRRRTRAARALMLSLFVGSLIAAILVGLPALIVASAVGRSRFRAAVRRRLAPAVAACAGPEQIR
jgi:hypothetical protein